MCRIYLMSMRIVCLDNEKWPISAKKNVFWVGGEGVCGRKQQCADNQTEGRKKASLGSHTHRTYEYTHQRPNIYVHKAQIHSIRHEKLCACLLAQKKGKERVTWLIFSTSNRPWRYGPCHVKTESTLWQSQSRLNTTKTDRKKRFDDIQHLCYTYS